MSETRTKEEITFKVEELREKAWWQERFLGKAKIFFGIFLVTGIMGFVLSILGMICFSGNVEPGVFQVTGGISLIILMFFIPVAWIFTRFVEERLLGSITRKRAVAEAMKTALELLEKPDGEAMLIKHLNKLLQIRVKPRRNLWVVQEKSFTLKSPGYEKQMSIQDQREIDAEIQAFSWIASPGGVQDSIE